MSDAPASRVRRAGAARARAVLGWASLGLFAPIAAAQTSAQDAAAARATMLARISSPIATATRADAPQALPYRVRLNGDEVGDALLLREDDGRLLLREADWRFWRLSLPTAPPRLIRDERYWALDEAPGFEASADDATQSIDLRFAPSAFDSHSLRASGNTLTEAELPAGVGGFMNYEAVATQDWDARAANRGLLNGQVETGVFGPWGVGVGQWVGLDLAGERELIRLETSWRMDDPQRMRSLQVGDAIGRPGLWGRAVRFGGLQWSRNFSTQPGYVSLPQPAIRGESALPSVLDVYVDGIRRESFSVPQGPFVIDNIPAVNGLGQVEVVVRDLLGREQVLTLPYLSGARQLRAGLHDWSYEAGFLRENFGSTREDYGRAVLTGLHRLGISDALTGEARIELREQGATGGLGGSLSIPRVGIVSAASAFSEQRNATGSLGFIAWERVLRRRQSLGARGVFTSPGFVQSGMAEDLQAPARLLAANLGFSLGGRVGVGLGYIAQRNRQRVPDTEAITASLSSRFGPLTVSMQAIARTQPSEDQLLSVFVTMPLAHRMTASTGYRHRRDEDGNWSGQGSARMQRNTPIGEGMGYRVAMFGNRSNGEADTAASAQAAVSFNAERGSAALEAATLEDRQSLRATLGGGLGYYAGHGFASRRISSGFGVVESGTAGVPLLLNNQRVARTGDDGVAIIPNLQSYQANLLRIDVGELPMDVEVESEALTVSPYHRSGMLISLPVRRVRGALVSLTTREGIALPPGTSLRFSGRTFPVGRQGLAHVTGLLEGTNILVAELPDGTCELHVDLPADAGVQPRLGPFACAGATP